MKKMIGGLRRLLDALGEETAVVVGHDWGAPMAWNSALLYPERYRAVAGLSVPYTPRSPRRRSTLMQADVRRQLLLHPVLPGAGRRRGGARGRPAPVDAAHPLRGIRRRAGGGRRSGRSRRTRSSSTACPSRRSCRRGSRRPTSTTSSASSSARASAAASTATATWTATGRSCRSSRARRCSSLRCSSPASGMA